LFAELPPKKVKGFDYDILPVTLPYKGAQIEIVRVKAPDPKDKDDYDPILDEAGDTFYIYLAGDRKDPIAILQSGLSEWGNYAVDGQLEMLDDESKHDVDLILQIAEARIRAQLEEAKDSKDKRRGRITGVISSLLVAATIAGGVVGYRAYFSKQETDETQSVGAFDEAWKTRDFPAPAVAISAHKATDVPAIPTASDLSQAPQFGILNKSISGPRSYQLNISPQSCQNIEKVPLEPKDKVAVVQVRDGNTDTIGFFASDEKDTITLCRYDGSSDNSSVKVIFEVTK
jgi:hypothetical protein